MPQPTAIEGQIHQFPAYLKRPRERRWWALVRVFSSGRAMQRYARVEYGHAKKDYRAIFFGIIGTDKAAKSSRFLGEILYCIKDLPHELVVHECAHAAVAWWRVINGMPPEAHFTLLQDEEQFVTALGRMANEVEVEVSKLRPDPDVSDD